MVELELEAEAESVSCKLWPLVSYGKSITESAEISNTSKNRTTAAVWWQPATSPTATIGHTIPPIRPIALATPLPVALIGVGYNYIT